MRMTIALPSAPCWVGCGCPCTIHADRCIATAALPLSLVRQLPSQRAHACIERTFGQLGSRKACDAQVFGADRIVLFDEVGRELVQEVGPPPGHTLMHACHLGAGLGPVATALLPAA